MKRRQFLSLVAAALPAALIVPELWTPSKSIFLPPAGGWDAPSVLDLWMEYAKNVVPCGVALQGKLMSGVHHLAQAREQGPFTVILSLADTMDAATERRLRKALTGPIPDMGIMGTMGSLFPWIPDDFPKNTPHDLPVTIIQQLKYGR